MCQRRYNREMFHERHVNRGGMKETTWSKRFWCSETAGPTFCWAGHVEPGQSSVCVCVSVHMSGVSVYMSVSWTEPLDRKQEAPSHTVNIESVDSLPCVFLLKVLFGFQWIYVGYSAVWLHRCQLLSVGPDWNISAASEGVHWNLIQTITRKKIWFDLPEKSDLTYLSFLADLNRMWKMIEHRLIFQKVEKGRKI